MSHKTSPVMEPSQGQIGTDSSRYRVVIYNDDVTPMDEVVVALMLATDCDAEEAYIEMWEAHNFGQSNVHFAAEDECQDIADLISVIGIQTDVFPEWSE